MRVELWEKGQWKVSRLVGATPIGDKAERTYILKADGGIINPIFWREVGSRKRSPHVRRRPVKKYVMNIYRKVDKVQAWLAGSFRSTELELAERMAVELGGEIVNYNSRYYIIGKDTP